MGEKIYVNGGILVKTRNFCFANGAICLQLEQPEGAILLEPTDEIEGERCLIIDDKHPQSIFNTYYAKSFITALFEGVDYLRNSYQECFNDTEEEIEEINTILSSIYSLDQKIKNSLMKFLYINMITILDSFVCSIILVTIKRDENLFFNYYEKMISNSDKFKLAKLLESENRGKWEKEIIEIILRTPFENMDKIKKAFGSVGLNKPQDINGVMSKHFKNRGVLVHRNGKMKDGERMIVTEEMVGELLEDTVSFIDRIKESIPLE